MRVEDSDDSEEWSVLSSTGQEIRAVGSSTTIEPKRLESQTPRIPSTSTHVDSQEGDAGLRRRTRKSHTVANPASSTPRDPERFPNPDESGLSRRTPRSRNSGDPPSETLGIPEPGSENPQRPISDPYPDPQTLGYPNPAETLPDARTERGTRRIPVQPTASRVEAMANLVVPVRGDGDMQGALFQYADDLAFVGNPELCRWSQDYETRRGSGTGLERRRSKWAMTCRRGTRPKRKWILQ